MNYLLLALIGFGGGLIIAAGLFAIVVTIRLVNRFAHITGTSDYVELYENMVIWGAILGNLFIVYNISLPGNEWLGGLYGVFSGLYSGAVVVAIAEVVKALPIFIRRVRISTGLSGIVITLAVGKTVGSLLDSFVF